MPCKCGKKVERHEPHKLVCLVCKQFVHSGCYNIAFSDLELIKNSFKCHECLSVRRRSLSASEFAAGDKTGSKETAAHSLDKTKCADVKNVNGSFPTVSLEVIYKELLSLKSDNRHLTNLVVSLRDDNERLVKEVGELSTIVRSVNFSESVKYSKKSSKPPVAGVNNIINKKADSNSSISINVSDDVSPFAVGANDDNTDDINIVSHSIANNTDQNLDDNKSISNSAQSSVPVIRANKSWAAVVSADADINTNNFTSRKKNNNVVVGLNKNSQLDVIVRKQWLHLSSFKPSVSADDIINYVADKSGIEKDFLACFKLLKHDVQLATVNKINFKFGSTSEHFDKQLDPNLWPTDVKIRPFRFRPKIGMTT